MYTVISDFNFHYQKPGVLVDTTIFAQKKAFAKSGKSPGYIPGCLVLRWGGVCYHILAFDESRKLVATPDSTAPLCRLGQRRTASAIFGVYRPTSMLYDVAGGEALLSISRKTSKSFPQALITNEISSANGSFDGRAGSTADCNLSNLYQHQR